MSRFSNLKSTNIQADTTAEFTIYSIEIDGENPVLIGRPAMEKNKPYYNALLKQSASMTRKASAGKVDAAMLQQNRAIDRQLFPQYVIVGWRNVKDDLGNEVAFTKEDCADFLTAIDDWVFDDVRNHFSNPVSFMTEEQAAVRPTSQDAEELGKNS